MDKKHILELEGLLAEHLKYNHFPPVTPLMVEPCKEAIFSILDYDYDKGIKVGDKIIPAHEIAEELHLDWFIDEWAEGD